MHESKPPKIICDINAEAAVVSAMLIDEECIPVVMAEIDVTDLTEHRNAEIFNAIKSLYTDNVGEAIDALTVIKRLEERGHVGAEWVKYINEIMDFVVTSVNVKSHINLIKRCTMLRGAETHAQEIGKKVRSGKSLSSIENNVSGLMDILASSSEKKRTGILSIIAESEKETMSYIDGTGKKKISYGWSQHDRMLRGMGPGNLIIIGARPSVGKTQYAVNLSRKLAMSGVGVYIKTYEMGAIEIVDRLVNLNSSPGIYFSREKDRRPDKVDRDYISMVYEKTYRQMAHAIIDIDDIASDDSVRLYSRLKQKKSEGRLGACILDYLQLMPRNKEQMASNDPLGQVSRSLKLSAKDLDVPIIALSQLNRNSARRQNKRPVLDDLRESGAIEQDADVVIFLYREDYENEAATNRGQMEVIVAKNRHGATGTIKMLYDRELGLMAEMDEEMGEYYGE